MFLHKIAIRRDGGDPGILDYGLVAMAADQPNQTFGGQDQYQTLVDKAAATAFAITANHSFADGNKRTGLLALDYALQLHGYQLIADPVDTYLVFCGVAEGTKDRLSFVQWVEKHITPIAIEDSETMVFRLPDWASD